ncbi:MAG: phosphoenolpyruvate synthase [Desulfovibrio sp.]|jgi:pyruvate,water dikinase|nr:phosphoenolpyruvate synthase [Desulfovibrio sp.]
MPLSLLRRLFGAESLAGNKEDQEREALFRARLQERCERFRRLLSANKKALEAMSDMEGHLAGTAPFGMGYLRSAVSAVAGPVQIMVGELNALSDGGYDALNDVFDRIFAAVSAKTDVDGDDEELVQGPLLLTLDQIGLTELRQVGGKMANLGEVKSHVGLAVPEGFAVTASAYYAFMRHNDLHREFAERITAADMDDLDEVFKLSAALQQSILAAPLLPELEDGIMRAVDAMKAKLGDGLLLALRSSAVGEDSLGVTFAGQYRSELHVPPDEACDVWKEIIAGKYSVTAMTYRFQRGIPDEAAPMCVGVLSMVNALAGGVAYSRDPVAAALGREQVLLNAVEGIPKAVVDGDVIPDVFTFSRNNPPQLLEKSLADLAGKRTRHSLGDEDAVEIARTALALESYYNEPQDVEWAIDGKGQLIILQTRPLREAARDTGGQGENAAARLPADIVVLAKGGVSVSPGLGMGSVFVSRKQADMLSFPPGGILVVEHAHPRWATLLSRAAGIVSETGGMAGHLASVAREYRLPAVFSLKNACSLLEGAGEVTLDADRAAVFAGKHPEIALSAARRDDLMADSPVRQRLQELGELVIPLHLLNPDSLEFAPEQCRTLHDITRFCHEKAVRIMFNGEDAGGWNIGKQLKAGAKLQYWVVDMGGGFTRQISGPVVDISEIASAPMLCLWAGMTSVPWTGPPAVGAAGFMSAVFESAMNRELENTVPTVMADRNYFIVSADYMILQARYGYHLCTVECRAGDDSHENFVSFQFKGGAADRDRRCLRAAMIGGLVEEQGFRADVRNDALFASAEGLDTAATLKKVRLLGYLLIHTRQVDMIMRESNRAKALEQKLRTEMAALDGKALPFCVKSVG